MVVAMAMEEQCEKVKEVRTVSVRVMADVSVFE